MSASAIDRQNLSVEHRGSLFVVVERKALSVNVTGVRFCSAHSTGPAEPSEFEWVPGQYVEISPTGAPDRGALFSIASAPRPERPLTFELAISNVGGRELLAPLSLGSTCSVSRAQGSFVRYPAPHSSLFIGIGTGVAPLRAMLQAALRLEEQDPLVLLVGARSRADLLWHEEFTALAAAHARFQYEPSLSEPDVSWSGRRGRVQLHLAELVRALPELRAYVCGSVPMVQDCVARLRTELGVHQERISSEAF